MLAWAKRIVLFVLVNFLVVTTISVVLHLLGVSPYLSYRGLDYQQLAMFCLVWGFGGALISLGLSRIMAKMMMGVQVIDPRDASGEARWLVETVHQLARSAGLTTMPEVGYYDSPEVNAFATGPTKSRALVAVSSGLLNRMDRDSVEGVLGHEIAHIANGDMVTMTLIQGVVNAFVMFLARVIGFALTQGSSRDGESRSSSHASQYLVTMLLEMVLGILGMMVVAWFSRWREFRADRGGAIFAGRDKMTRALRSLQASVERVQPEQNSAIASLKISGRSGGLLALFSTHPPLEERIARLETMTG